MEQLGRAGMVANTEVIKTTGPGRREQDLVVAATLIGSHSVQHMYARGFLIIIPQIYANMGLAAIQVGMLDAIRQFSGGVFSMGGGLVTDRLQHRRGLFLGVSLGLMALGYLLVGLAPSYMLILAALSLASAAGSLWHPPALGILSQRFPERRGFVLSLHRSTGNLGETISPILVGALLVAVTWQTILQWASIPTFLLAAVILVFLWNVGGPNLGSGLTKPRSMGRQLKDLGALFRQKGLAALILLAGFRGMGDRGLLLFLPLYLAQDLGMTSLWQGIHLALLTTAAIVCGPLIGVLSDRWGRKPAMVMVMGVSTVISGLMILGNSGIILTILVALMGTVMFSVNSLVQAAAMDLAEGRQLEGSLVGLLWGTNAVFGFFPPIILGALAGAFGFGVIFPYSAALYLIGTFLAISLPHLKSSDLNSPSA